MIEVKLQDKDHQLRSSWNDVTFEDYCTIVFSLSKPFIERLALYTGIEVATLNKLNFTGIKALTEIVSFMDHPDTVNAFAHEYESELNIAHETYGKMEAAKQAINAKDHPLLGIGEVIQLYTDQEIAKKPVTEVISQVAFFIDRLGKFLVKYKKLGEYEPTPEEEEAGLDQLSMFGSWATAVAYARRTNMRPRDVFELPAHEVYTTLLLDFEQSEFERRLGMIRERNARMNIEQNR